MNCNVDVAKQLVRIANLSAKAGRIAAARVEFVESDEAIFDALEAGVIEQEALGLLKALIESSLVENENSD